MQEIIVYIIIAATAFIIIRYVWRQAKSKSGGCNCGCGGSCGNSPDRCHCCDTRK